MVFDQMSVNSFLMAKQLQFTSKYCPFSLIYFHNVFGLINFTDSKAVLCPFQIARELLIPISRVKCAVSLIFSQTLNFSRQLDGELFSFIWYFFFIMLNREVQRVVKFKRLIYTYIKESKVTKQQQQHSSSNAKEITLQEHKLNMAMISAKLQKIIRRILAMDNCSVD